MFTTENLTPADMAAVTAHLGDELSARCGGAPVDAEWLYHRLADVADTRLMIARAALKGVTKLPPDPRLNPKPWPLPPSRRAEAGETVVADKGFPLRDDDPTLPADEAVVVGVGECAAAPGSRRHQRFQLWRCGATIGQLRAEGLRLSDLRRDLSAGRVKLGRPEVLN